MENTSARKPLGARVPKPVSASNSLPSSSSTTNSTVHVYTYGYCCKNNERGSRGAIGVYVQNTPIDDPGNISALTSLYHKQTSEAASLLAVHSVAEAAKRVSHPLHRHFKPSSSGVQVVVHVDTSDTKDWCTARGAQLAKEGFPPRPSIDLIRLVYKSCALLQQSNKLRVILANRKYIPDLNAMKMAKRLAKQAVTKAIAQTEKSHYYLNSHFGMCVYDDGPRYKLNVPHHEHKYAASKGAWYDDEQKTFFVYENDVGCHYDMRRVDFLNLRNMFDAPSET